MIKNFFVRLTGIKPYRLHARTNNYVKSIYAYMRHKQFPIFHWIAIETSSYCNRKCKSCPVSIFPREKRFMSNKTFNNIIINLTCLNYSGIIHLHLYNEPLADPTIVEKCRIISKSLPNAQLMMNSNGDLLTVDLLKHLVEAGLKELYVSQYQGRISKHMLKILCEAKGTEKQVLRVEPRSNFVGNRAGLLNNVTIRESLLTDCNRPSNQLVVNYKGDVVLCCNDYLGKVVLGNVNETPLLNIWNCEKLASIRKLLGDRNRDQIEMCKKCNYFGDIYDSRDLTEHEIYTHNRIFRKEIKKYKIIPYRINNLLQRLRM